MRRDEFAQVMGYVTAAIGKPLSQEATEVYFDLLGDLPVEALRIGAKRVALEHKWPSFPSVAELREASVATVRGEIQPMAAGEAWIIARRVIARCDVDIEGSLDRAMANVPPIVRETIRRFDFMALYNPSENVETMRAQFTRIFDDLVAREHRHALLPASVKQAIQAIGQKQEALPAPVLKLVSLIGKDIEAS